MLIKLNLNKEGSGTTVPLPRELLFLLRRRAQCSASDLSTAALSVYVLNDSCRLLQ